MFLINYKIVPHEYDEFVGQNGFFQLVCNGHSYGDMFPVEIENEMDTVSIFDWFERLLRVIKNLKTKEYVALSDVESFNLWIEFERENDNLKISVILSEKEDGSHDIEYQLSNIDFVNWGNQIISFEQFKEEIANKAGLYIDYVIAHNEPDEKYVLFKKKINAV